MARRPEFGYTELYLKYTDKKTNKQMTEHLTGQWPDIKARIKEIIDSRQYKQIYTDTKE